MSEIVCAAQGWKPGGVSRAHTEAQRTETRHHLITKALHKRLDERLVLLVRRHGAEALQRHGGRLVEPCFDSLGARAAHLLGRMAVCCRSQRWDGCLVAYPAHGQRCHAARPRTSTSCSQTMRRAARSHSPASTDTPHSSHPRLGYMPSRASGRSGDGRCWIDRHCIDQQSRHPSASGPRSWQPWTSR